MAENPRLRMERRLKAGREYLASLRRLAFEPQSLLWAAVGDSKLDPEADMELLIVTSWVDNIGPKVIYDLLFEAYDASATPKEIDPFIVTLFSPQTAVARDIQSAVHTIRTESIPRNTGTLLFLGMLDYATMPEWVIHHRDVRTSRFEDTRHFAAFQRNIEQLAA